MGESNEFAKIFAGEYILGFNILMKVQCSLHSERSGHARPVSEATSSF